LKGIAPGGGEVVAGLQPPPAALESNCARFEKCARRAAV